MRAVVSGDGEGILLLREVSGVPFCGSSRAGAWQASVVALGALHGAGKKKTGRGNLGFYMHWGPGRGSRGGASPGTSRGGGGQLLG
jgi:hypothetical protein